MKNGADLGSVSIKRFGLRYSPPSIVVEYENEDTGKLFHRRIEFLEQLLNSDAKHIAGKLREKHAVLLGEDKVSMEQLESLVRKLQETSREFSRPILVRHPISGECTELRHWQGKDSIAQLKAAIEVKTGKDARKQQLLFRDEKLEDDSTLESLGIRGGSELTLVLYAEDYANLDLNKLSTEDLDKHKATMDILFNQHRKKPTDTDFVYDIQVDFSMEDNADPSGWDSDDD